MEPSQSCCLVCRTVKDIGNYGICCHCEEFMSDSVTEGSHAAMSCIQSGEHIANHLIIVTYLLSGQCQVNPGKTESFSACPGCWMSRLKMTGVLDQYLASVSIKLEPEVVMEEEEADEQEGGCVICNRDTEDKFRDKTVCGNCKKFYQRCVKTRCYKDFYCHNDARCDLKHKSPCSFCWWHKFVDKKI